MPKKEDKEYIISEEGVKKAVSNALDEYSEGEITKSDKKSNFFTLKMFGKNIGGAILGKKSNKNIEGKYLQNTEENISKITELILDSGKQHKTEPNPVPIPIVPPKPEPEPDPPKEENKRKNIIIPLAITGLVGGAIGMSISSGGGDIIKDDTTIVIEYDSTENTLDAITDLEYSSDDLIYENRSIVDVIKGTQSDIREEASLLGRPFSEQERVDSENMSLEYMTGLEEIEAQRDSAIAQYALIKEPTDADKLKYSLTQLDIQNKALNFKVTSLTKAIELKNVQSGLIQEHSDAGYDKEGHSKELSGNNSLVGNFKIEIKDAKDSLTRNQHIQAHFRNIDLEEVQDFDEYFDAYVTGIQNSDIDKLDEFDQTFSSYKEYVKKYKTDFKATDFRKYMPTLRAGKEQGKSVDEINKAFNKATNPEKSDSFFKE